MHGRVVKSQCRQNMGICDAVLSMFRVETAKRTACAQVWCWEGRNNEVLALCQHSQFAQVGPG